MGLRALFPSYVVGSPATALSRTGLHGALGTGDVCARQPSGRGMACLTFWFKLLLLYTSIYMYNKWGLANYVVLSGNEVPAGTSPISAHYL